MSTNNTSNNTEGFICKYFVPNEAHLLRSFMDCAAQHSQAPWLQVHKLTFARIDAIIVPVIAAINAPSYAASAVLRFAISIVNCETKSLGLAWEDTKSAAKCTAFIFISSVVVVTAFVASFFLQGQRVFKLYEGSVRPIQANTSPVVYSQQDIDALNQQLQAQKYLCDALVAKNTALIETLNQTKLEIGSLDLENCELKVANLELQNNLVKLGEEFGHQGNNCEHLKNLSAIQSKLQQTVTALEESNKKLQLANDELQAAHLATKQCEAQAGLMKAKYDQLVEESNQSRTELANTTDKLKKMTHEHDLQKKDSIARGIKLESKIQELMEQNLEQGVYLNEEISKLKENYATANNALTELEKEKLELTEKLQTVIESLENRTSAFDMERNLLKEEKRKLHDQLTNLEKEFSILNELCANTKKELTDLVKENQNLNNVIEQLKGRESSLQEEIANLKLTIESHVKEIKTLGTKIYQAENEKKQHQEINDQMTQAVERLTAEMDEKEKELKALKDKIQKLLASSNECSEYERLERTVDTQIQSLNKLIPPPPPPPPPSPPLQANTQEFTPKPLSFLDQIQSFSKNAGSENTDKKKGAPREYVWKEPINQAIPLQKLISKIDEVELAQKVLEGLKTNLTKFQTNDSPLNNAAMLSEIAKVKLEIADDDTDWYDEEDITKDAANMDGLQSMFLDTLVIGDKVKLLKRLEELFEAKGHQIARSLDFLKKILKERQQQKQKTNQELFVHLLQLNATEQTKQTETKNETANQDKELMNVWQSLNVMQKKKIATECECFVDWDKPYPPKNATLLQMQTAKK